MIPLLRDRNRQIPGTYGPARLVKMNSFAFRKRARIERTRQRSVGGTIVLLWPLHARA